MIVAKRTRTHKRIADEPPAPSCPRVSAIEGPRLCVASVSRLSLYFAFSTARFSLLYVK
ncbi:hypothetical protein RSAG8_00841, partial [Rhizoctonia solani AG-8 WAC10335]